MAIFHMESLAWKKTSRDWLLYIQDIHVIYYDGDDTSSQE